MRWSPRFRLTAGAATMGLVALLLVVSMVGAQWSEAPAGPTVVVPMPPLAAAPRSGPAPGPMLARKAPSDEPNRPPDTVAAAAFPTQADPALPDEFALLPPESIAALQRSSAEWESRAIPAASSATRSGSMSDGSPSGVEEASTVQAQSGRSAPEVADDAADLRSAANIRVASQATTADDNSALPAGEIRVFIHHVADQRDGALAERLADYLRDQGFTVADIRTVDFGIGKPSVRYFFGRDRVASERLVEALGRFVEAGSPLAPDHASDFTHFVPKPRPGSVEVWLPAS
jgi:hypothetical protein